MSANDYLQMHEIMHSSVLEKHIGNDVVPVTLRLKRIGEHIAYLHAETDDEGIRKVRGVIDLCGKKYECALVQSSSLCGILLIMPLDDGSYL